METGQGLVIFQMVIFPLSTSLQSKNKDKRSDDQKRLQADGDETLTPDEQQAQMQYIRDNPSDFVDFNTAWTLQLSYSLSYNRYLSSRFGRFYF